MTSHGALRIDRKFDTDKIIINSENLNKWWLKSKT